MLNTSDNHQNHQKNKSEKPLTFKLKVKSAILFDCSKIAFLPY